VRMASPAHRPPRPATRRPPASSKRRAVAREGETERED